MRVEIKMPYNSDQIIMIEKNLASIKELRKHHPDRVVNSIYYDNLNFSIAKDNIDGLSKRCKIRIRHYGDTKSNNCNVEIKKKINKFGFKAIFSLDKKINEINLDELFSLKNNLYKDLIKDSFTEKFMTQDYLQPQINVSYSREYFIFGNIRLTHDKKINYRPYGNNKFVTESTINDSINVLEFKFDYTNLEEVKFILEKIKLKPKRFSKYLRGLSFFNSAIYL
jgi:hypothetical protein